MRVLFLDLSAHLNSLEDFQTRAQGGRVSSLLRIPDALSKFGHQTWILSDIRHGGTTPAGTRWLTVNEQLPSVDVLVLNRGIGSGYVAIDAKKRVLWTHDLPHNGFALEPKVLNAIDLTVFMSQYAEDVWRSFFQGIRRSVVIPNGVDRDLFHPREKDLGYLIYASAPNRGLNRLPLIFDAIRSRVKRPVRMTAYSNLEVLHPGEKPSEDRYEKDGYRFTDYGSNSVQMLDPIPQKDLAVELGTAGLMILPTDYPEICSNAVLQSLSCGTPIVTTGGIGSAGEWVRHGKNGMLTRWRPVDYMVYMQEIVRNATAVLDDELQHRKMIERASRSKGLFTWDEIGRQWDKALRKLF